MPTEVVIGPTQEPVTLDEVKEHLRIEYDHENLLLHQYLRASREMAEYILQQQLITATLRDWFDNFPSLCDAMRLNRWPVTSVTNIQYYDTDGTLQTWDSANYITDFVSRPARIMVHPDAVWPVPQRRINAVQVNYVAGRAQRGDVPQAVVNAILLHVGWSMENRDEAKNHDVAVRAMRRLLSPQRVRVA